MKKLISVTVALMLAFSVSVSAFAFSDVEKGSTVETAVNKLSALGIITGFEDGTFHPDDTITRAQMAAIICRTFGLEEKAKKDMGTSYFADVPEDHWASGYITAAQEEGIINGYGNGNFGPEDEVLFEQVIKMVVYALGYEFAAIDAGGYPMGYIYTANRLDALKGVSAPLGTPAPRGMVATIIYNSLDVTMNLNRLAKNISEVTYSGTILTNYFNEQ